MKKAVFPASVLVIVVAGAALTVLGLHALGLLGGDGQGGRILPRNGSSRADSRHEPGHVVTESGPDRTSPVSNSGDSGKQDVPPHPFDGIRGIVRDALTGEALQIFTVQVFGSNERDVELKARVEPGKVFRNTDGLFTLKNLDEGIYILLLKCTGYQDLWCYDLRVPQRANLIEFGIQRGTHISGRVVDTTGKPVKDMSVFIKCSPFNPDDPPPARRTAITDGNGRFLFGDLVEGSYDILLESLSDPLDGVSGILLTKGGTFDKEFVIPLFNKLVFKVSAPNGIPLNDVSIRLSSETRMFRAKTQHEGKAVLERVPPGEYELVLAKLRFKMKREMYNLTTLAGESVIERILEFEL